MQPFNDYIDFIHIHLFEDDCKYREYLGAVYDEDAVEGALSIDDVKAAEKIREYARRFGMIMIGHSKLKRIIAGLHSCSSPLWYGSKNPEIEHGAYNWGRFHNAARIKEDGRDRAPAIPARWPAPARRYGALAGQRI